MRIRHADVVRVAMDACASGASAPGETFAAYGEIVWFWRRDPGVKLAGKARQVTGARKAAPRGEYV